MTSYIDLMYSFSELMLLVGSQEGHWACRNLTHNSRHRFFFEGLLGALSNLE